MLTKEQLVDLLDQANIQFKSLPLGSTADDVVNQIKKELIGDTKYQAPKDHVNIYQQSCFTIDLDALINTKLQFNQATIKRLVMEDITNIFNTVVSCKLWPLDVQSPEVIENSIELALTRNYFSLLINSKNNLLIVGNPEHIHSFTPGIDLGKLKAGKEQFKEIGSPYPNWAIQSPLVEDL